jgi:archaeal type IV pilus assembly protein PilA
MKGTHKRFGEAKRGVSPVIGVVLMVAVVVILAAVIGAFVLGLGGEQQTTPQASFSVQDGTLVMSGGDTLDGENIAVEGDGVASSSATGEITAGTEVAELSDTGAVRVIYTGNGQSSVIWRTTLDGGGGGE